MDWPYELLKHNGAAEEWGDTDDRVLFKGVCMVCVFLALSSLLLSHTRHTIHRIESKDGYSCGRTSSGARPSDAKDRICGTSS